MSLINSLLYQDNVSNNNSTFSTNLLCNMIESLSTSSTLNSQNFLGNSGKLPELYDNEQLTYESFTRRKANSLTVPLGLDKTLSWTCHLDDIEDTKDVLLIELEKNNVKGSDEFDALGEDMNDTNNQIKNFFETDIPPLQHHKRSQNDHSFQNSQQFHDSESHTNFQIVKDQDYQEIASNESYYFSEKFYNSIIKFLDQQGLDIMENETIIDYCFKLAKANWTKKILDNECSSPCDTPKSHRSISNEFKLDTNTSTLKKRRSILFVSPKLERLDEDEFQVTNQRIKSRFFPRNLIKKNSRSLEPATPLLDPVKMLLDPTESSLEPAKPVNFAMNNVNDNDNDELVDDSTRDDFLSLEENHHIHIHCSNNVPQDYNNDESSIVDNIF